MLVYHRSGAGRPIRVIWALEEMGLPYELTTVTSDEAAAPEHLARHPLGRVPVLEDRSGPLFESAALCLHLADLGAPDALIPAIGTRARALVYQWTLFGMTELEAPIVQAFRCQDEAPDVARRARQQAARAAAGIDRALDGRPYLVGETLTVADIVVSEVLRIVRRVGGDDLSAGLVTYLDGLKQRAARARAVAKLA
jgi:glutathione S-transferase